MEIIRRFLFLTLKGEHCLRPIRMNKNFANDVNKDSDFSSFLKSKIHVIRYKVFPINSLHLINICDQKYEESK